MSATIPMPHRPCAASLPPLPTGLLIDGAWVGCAAGFDVHDPATGEVLASVADATPRDALRALDAAVDAAEEWAATPARTRSAILSEAYRLVVEDTDRLATVMTLEMGKPLDQARGEVAYGAEFLRWFAEEAVRITGDSRDTPSGSMRLMVSRRPVGPCVLVTPWNFPLAMATRKIGPALAAGCTCVVKPAEQTPLTTLVLGELLVRAGVPDGVVGIVTTSDPGPVVSALLHDERTRKLSFTGSTEVGRRLLVESADTVLRTSMELGGNAPLLVFDDADLDVAVTETMAAKMRNIGQACTAANRILVHRPVADEYLRRLTARMAALRVGPGILPGVDVGPLVDADAVAKVERLVTDACERGARVLTGGRRGDGPGFFYEPTVLADVPPDAEIARTEIFGPVAAVSVFDDEAEAVRRANDTPFGLVSYVFTESLRRGLRVSDALDTGMVGLNRGVVSDPAAPFGGVKQSGLGREGGLTGIDEFLETKYVGIGM